MMRMLNPEWKRTVRRVDAEYFARKVNAVFVSEVNLDNLMDAIEEAKKRTIPVFPNGAELLANKILKL